MSKAMFIRLSNVYFVCVKRTYIGRLFLVLPRWFIGASHVEYKKEMAVKLIANLCNLAFKIYELPMEFLRRKGNVLLIKKVLEL